MTISSNLSPLAPSGAAAETVRHTPGPWKRTKDLGQAVVRARGVMVADCNIFGRNAPSEAQCVANARLIAAAPDLFAALQGLVDAFEGASHTAVDVAMAKARSALFAVAAATDGGRE